MPRKTKAPPAAAQLQSLRRELRELARTVNEQAIAVQRNRKDHELTFRRMAQLQAELDDIKRAWTKLSTRRGS